MTITDAISAELIPFSVDTTTLDKVCIDLDLDSVKEYAKTDKKSVAKATVEILNRLIILASESEGGYSQGYNIEAIKARISSLIAANGLTDMASSSPTIKNASGAW